MKFIPSCINFNIFSANDKIYKWNAAIPPKKGQLWNSDKNTFEFMKFNINKMSTLAEDKKIFTLTSSDGIDYFDYFDNFFPLVFNVPTDVREASTAAKVR